MSKKFIIRGLLLSVVHWVVAVGLFMFASSATMEAFDDSSVQISIIAKIASVIVDVLWQPFLSVWTPWMSKNIPNSVEWIAFILNSMLWGFAISLFLRFAVQKIKSRQPI